MNPEQMIARIAARVGCTAVICRAPADYCSDNERVTDAINETTADDRPVVDETPFVDGFSWPGYDYLERDEWEQDWRNTYNDLRML